VQRGSGAGGRVGDGRPRGDRRGAPPGGVALAVPAGNDPLHARQR
jgi:hypothetical protein